MRSSPWLPALVRLLAGARHRAQQLADSRAARKRCPVPDRTGILSAEKFEERPKPSRRRSTRIVSLSIAHYGLGQAYMNMRRFASAVQAYQAASMRCERFTTWADEPVRGRRRSARTRSGTERDMLERPPEKRQLTLRPQSNSGCGIWRTSARQSAHRSARRRSAAGPRQRLLQKRGPRSGRNEWKAAIDGEPEARRSA